MGQNNASPHQAVISVTIEVHELDKDNQCSGKLVKGSDLKKHNLKRDMLLTVAGFSKDDCLSKLSKKMKDFNDG